MKALVLKNGKFKLSNIPKPKPKGNEALIKITLVGICNTDIELSLGYMGFQGVPGHEFVGIVEEASGKSALMGKRVVGEINIGCGKCSLCKAGDSRHCSTRTVLGILNRQGAFAEYLTMPVDNLYKVPKELSDKVAVFTEPVAAALEIHEQVKIKRNDQVLVMGDGKLGLLCAQAASLKSSSVFVVGKHAEKLALLPKKIKSAIKGRIPKSWPHKFDIVVDCTGSSQGLSEAVSLVKPRSTIVLKSTVADASTFPAAEIVINEITVVGSRCGPFRKALAALKKGDINVGNLVTDVYPFEEGVKAFELAQSGNAMKVLLKVADS